LLDRLCKLAEFVRGLGKCQAPNIDGGGQTNGMREAHPRSLTTLVNQHFGMTFYEFVNHYRVLETKAKLADPAFAGITVQRIFEEAGFNSKSTFNTFFRKTTGKTPSEFRRFAQVSEAAG
jgi:AraC-like DNA-binding protein